VLEVQKLYKSFDDLQVIEDLSFKISPGTIFGLVGPNGAGKTTTMRLILNIFKPDSGEITLDDIPRHKLSHERFGYLPEERGLYQRSRVLDLLIYFGLLNKLSRHRAGVEAIRNLDRFGMVDYTLRRISDLSKGMQQKLQFIAATMHDPDVMIFDEPLTGFDPINQIVLKDMLAQYKYEGKIILLSTHQMSEVEQLCDHICLINQGRNILAGSLPEIKKRFSENIYYIESEEDLTFLHDFKFIKVLEEQNTSCKFTISDQKIHNKFVQSLFEKISIKKFIHVEPSLHDIFIKLVQKANHDT